MAIIFDLECINVRYFNADKYIDNNTPVTFEINIRHQEEENPRTIFNNALKIAKDEN